MPVLVSNVSDLLWRIQSSSAQSSGQLMFSKYLHVSIRKQCAADETCQHLENWCQEWKTYRRDVWSVLKTCVARYTTAHPPRNPAAGPLWRERHADFTSAANQIYFKRIILFNIISNVKTQFTYCDQMKTMTNL